MTAEKLTRKLMEWPSKVKILFLSHSCKDKDAGASRIYHILESGLQNRGHHVTILHYADFRPIGIKAIQRVIDRLALPQFIHWRVRDILRKDFDIIMSSSGMSYSIFRRFRYRRGTRASLISHIHGLSIFDHQANLLERLAGRMKLSIMYRFVSAPMTLRWEERVSKYADLTIVQNDRDYDFLTRSYQTIAIEKIAPGVYNRIVEAGHANFASSRDRKSLLWFGSWTPRKGIFAIPKAFELILDAIPDARLTIGGAHNMETEIRASFSSKANERLIVLGKISVEEQLEEFRRHSVFLFPSLSEGFGLALLEAMVMGLAVVTTDTGVGGDSLVHGRDAWIVPKGSAIHLARGVISLLHDDPLREQIAGQGRLLALSFTEEKMVNTYEAAFLRCIKSSTTSV